MPSDVVGLDPERVRVLAQAMGSAARAWRAGDEALARIAAGYLLAEELGPVRAALADAAADHERAAADLAARADLIEAVDRGDWAAVHGPLSRVVSRTEIAWEAELPGGPDEGAASTWTVSTWDDLQARIFGSIAPVAGPLCAADRWYREAGTLIGPDGQAYPILLPNVRHPKAGDEDERPVVNADWGTPPDEGVHALLGDDPGWTTVAVETGAGRMGGDLSVHERLLIAASGQAGGRYLSARGLRPAPREAYQRLGVDEHWVPNGVALGRRQDVAVPDVVDETAGVTPEMVVTAGGHVRYEATVPASVGAVLAGGAAELIAGVATGTANVRAAEDLRNLAYAVEYQANDDGRTRATIRSYQLAIGGDEEVYVTMGYVGIGSDGPQPLVEVVPRINGDYAPTFTTNGIEPA